MCNRTVQDDERAKEGKEAPGSNSIQVASVKGKQKGQAKRPMEWEREVQGMAEG